MKDNSKFKLGDKVRFTGKKNESEGVITQIDDECATVRVQGGAYAYVVLSALRKAETKDGAL